MYEISSGHACTFPDYVTEIHHDADRTKAMAETRGGEDGPATCCDEKSSGNQRLASWRDQVASQARSITVPSRCRTAPPGHASQHELPAAAATARPAALSL